MNRLITAALSLAVLGIASSVSAQNIPESPASASEPLVSSYNASFLQDLPTADNLFQVIEVLQPTIVTDRFSAGGLSLGQPSRIGGFLPSWSQTRFSIAGVPFSDPTGTGGPMLWPELLLWSNVLVATGSSRANSSMYGLGIELLPPTPGDQWTGTVEGALSKGRMNSTGAADLVPSIARVSGFDRVAFTTSGPLSDHLGATFAFSATGSASLDRRDAAAVDARVFSGFTQLLFAPNRTDDVRVIGWGQSARSPFAFRQILSATGDASTGASGGHGQFAWSHRPDAGLPWTITAGYSERHDTPDYGATTGGIIERLTDGPVDQFASLAQQTVRAFSVGAHVDPQFTSGGVTHKLSFGFEGDGGRLRTSEPFNGTIGELVHGAPARLWAFSAPSTGSNRTTMAIAGFAQDRFDLGGRLSLDAGLRFEAIRGKAKGAQQDIQWQSLLPRAALQLSLTTTWRTAAFASYSRSAQRLTLDALAYGDPGAPTAAISRWTALAGYPLSLTDRGALISIVGPGTGGNPALSTIDPDLKRPTADEVVLGLQAQPRNGVLLRFAGVTRKEHNLWGVVNVGSPAYTTFTVADPGGDVLSSEDDTTLTVYNRVPASYLKDQFRLTTPGHSGSTFRGLELTLQFDTRHVTVTGGATAGIAETFANSGGYGPLENDQTVLGELFTNPNASNFPRGRPFTDRAYTAKLAGVFRLPADTRLGLIARYQDGQPFSRVVVFPGLNQGAEAVRGFANGDSRFMYIGTLDVRVQKSFRAGGRRVDAFIDGYNVLNMRNSVEEDVASLPNVRIPIALQPPLSVHAGVRVAF